jgi:hypothetical protein
MGKRDQQALVHRVHCWQKNSVGPQNKNRINTLSRDWQTQKFFFFFYKLGRSNVLATDESVCDHFWMTKPHINNTYGCTTRHENMLENFRILINNNRGILRNLTPIVGVVLWKLAPDKNHVNTL